MITGHDSGNFSEDPFRTVSAMTPEQLLHYAAEAGEKAYAPYSHFHVGAALVTESGRLFFGCNVENGSFGMTICAERGAVAAWRVAGGDLPVAVAVVGRRGIPCMPCGACRQVLAEFNPALRIVLEEGASFRIFSLGELLPFAFSLRDDDARR
jgi:cytidine deaminase